MKVKNKKNVAKAISAIGKTHKIKRNKIKRLTEKKGKKKKISKKALIEVGLKNEKPKAKVQTTQPITNDNLIKLTNISYKGAPESTTPSLYKPQKKVDGDKTPVSFIQRMKDKLKGARFRYINEQFYSSSSQEAFLYFKKEPSAFKAYHNGYMQQVTQWPVKPLDVIIKQIKPILKKSNVNSPVVVADFGCGDAKLARAFPKVKVHSFDFVAVNQYVTAGDMAHTSLANGSVDIAVFCLSLMGTNLQSFIKEANRVLKTGGLMKIAEVESRFDNISTFVDSLAKYGFEKIKVDQTIEMFVFMDFKKTQDISKTALKKKLPILELKPCIYKKR
ncbi:PREDICTED: 25S rRNA (adenine(645)-N(1))-methyltransferase [Diuraphis noxia]|uniref:25S rRNA (adenine(645)-N(1))-methyltransferase n=1 Tax=Diuraphis noxia TaxID=143948 RepID=UPI00076372F2|nr:PREDICTED: 25S rRNA (adenine(645)-N(1))-methyltransferase [Diuraphis noxia]